jgi:HAMP domain-containing protein
VFVLVFNFFIHRYVIKPIAVLAQQVKTNIKCGKPLDMNIETTDELRDLAVAVKELTTTRRRTL